MSPDKLRLLKLESELFKNQRRMAALKEQFEETSELALVEEMKLERRRINKLRVKTHKARKKVKENAKP